MFPHNNCFTISRRLIWKRNIFASLSCHFLFLSFFSFQLRIALVWRTRQFKINVLFDRRRVLSFYFYCFLLRDFFFLFLQFLFGQFDRLPCHLKKKLTYKHKRTKICINLSQFHQYFSLSLFHYIKHIYLSIYLCNTHTHACARTRTREDWKGI